MPSRIQFYREVKYSLTTIGVYSLGIGIFVVLGRNGFENKYSTISEYGYFYFFGSILIMILLHDTYYYWTHRLMHHQKLFKRVHLLHHSFKNPSPWCAFAFHPLEAIISMGVIPIIVYTIPWHHWALIIFVSFMMVYDTFIHLGYHLKVFKWNSWQNSPKDHDVHHRDTRHNFGLYFTFWDRLMGTYV